MAELPVDDLLSVDQAIEILDAVAVTPRQIELGLSDPLLPGTHLAQDIHADRDYPPFDKSLVDGFAVRAADRGARKVIGMVAAGGQEQSIIATAGACVAIMTGAPLPPGFDAVVPIEQTDARSFDVQAITITDEPVPGRYVSRRGIEARQGDVVLRAGVRVTSTVIGVLATVGVNRLRVVDRPRVGVLTTGDEIVDSGLIAGSTQIRNSNGPQLIALLRALGAEPHLIGHVGDAPDQIRAAIEAAPVDILLVTGGMSMGAHDYVPRVLQDLGYHLRITKLKIKPGKPFVFGVRRDDTAVFQPPFVFGLPGNPVSGFVCTLRFASRIIRRMQHLSPEPRWISFTLDQSLPANGPREFYQPITLAGGQSEVLSWKGSADVFTLARANALLVRRAHEGAKEAGDAAVAMEIPL